LIGWTISQPRQDSDERDARAFQHNRLHLNVRQTNQIGRVMLLAEEERTGSTIA